MLRPRAKVKGIDLRFEMADELPDHFVGDPLRLRQVLLNLLGNGVKFTNHGEVVLRVEEIESTPAKLVLRFTIRDTGLGINEEVRKLLFLPFTQADTSTTRRFGGTGLGLAISQRLVQLMGGQIEVESQVGEGSRFFFTIPFGRVDEPRKKAHELPVHRRPIEGKHRILLAEDNAISQVVVSEQLASLGLSVVVASTGREVLELLERQSFDLVLMDCQMPELDGYEATRRIRQQEIGAQHLPIVALTAHAMAGDREKCLAAGMDDYMAKPFSEEDLGAILEIWLPGSKG